MRSKVEWLLIPVILLPTAVLVALMVWAYRTHAAECNNYRQHGTRLAREWLSPGGKAASIRAHALDHYERLLREHEDETQRVTFSHPRMEGVVVGAEASLPATWRFGDGLPTGMTLPSLQDDTVLARIEHGTPPVVAGDVDEETRELAVLLRDANVERLARAPLAVSTKLFVTTRWQHAGTTERNLKPVLSLLRALSEMEAHRAFSSGETPVGSTPLSDAVVLSAGAARPMIVCIDATQLQPMATTTKDREGPVALTWSPTPLVKANGALWDGVLTTPIAGYVSFTTPNGGSWWHSPRFRPWLLPGILFTLALTVLPLLLLVSFQRRRRLDEQRTRFINEIAHDLRTPLTSVRLYADLLAKNAADASTRQRHVSTLQQESSRLTALLGNLLDLSRLDGEQAPLSLVEVRVDDAVSRAISDLRLAYPHRADDVSQDGPRDCTVVADAAVLSRVLANLLDNAAKYTATGTRILVTWSDRGDSVALLVDDEGEGIPSTDAERVFRRYERRKVHVDAGVRGSGLGLALVEELVAAMHGRVRLLASSRGAQFEIELPRSVGEVH